MNTYYSVEKWSIQTYNTGSSLWQTTTSWPRGSVSTYSKKYESTSQVVDLADGSQGMFTPSSHFAYTPMTFTWNRRTVYPTFKTNLETYLNDHTGVKITLHDASIVQGYIMSVEEISPFTGTTQQYEIIMEFKPFSVDGNSVKTG